MLTISSIMKDVADCEDGDMQTVLISHVVLLTIHTKALACHCECLGMNAENASAVCCDSIPPFNQGHYLEVMQKWELANEKGEPII